MPYDPDWGADIQDLIPSKQTGPAGGRRFSAPLVGGSPAPPPMGSTRQVVPPHVYRPPGAIDFVTEFQQTGRNAGNTPAVPAALSTAVPPNNVAFLRSITLACNNMLTSTDLRFRFRQNGAPIQGWGQLTMFPRAAASVTITYGPEEVLIPIGDGATISVEWEVLDGGTYQLGVNYHGWWLSKELWARWEGLVG